MAEEVERLRLAADRLADGVAKLYGLTVPPVERGEPPARVELRLAVGDQGQVVRTNPAPPEIRTKSEPPAKPPLRIVRNPLK